MSLYNIFDITGTAMSAQSVRLNTVASNLANADVVSTTEQEAYRSRQPVFATVMAGISADPMSSPVAGQFSAMQADPSSPAGVGVRVADIIESTAAARKMYEPDHPLANDEGYVFRSNVNSIEEMTNMMAASRSYQNTVEVFNTSKQLLLKTLNIGK